MALSFSLADTYSPSYGYTSHRDQYIQWLGDAGTIYDGLPWTPFTQGAMAAISFPTHVGILYDTGDREHLSVWIDWYLDRDSDADDDEVVNWDDTWFDLGKNTSLYNIMVPGDAFLGQPEMRARLVYHVTLFPADSLLGGMASTDEIEGYRVNIEPVPEPRTVVLLGSGLLGLVLYTRASKWIKKR